MKLRLPLSLFAALTALFVSLPASVHAVEVPEDYTSYELDDPYGLYDYRTSSEKLAFQMIASYTYKPSTTTWWQSGALKQNGSVLFTLAEDEDPRGLTFDGGSYWAFNVNSFRVEDIGRLTFSGIQSSAYDNKNPSGSTSSYNYHSKGGAVAAKEVHLLRNTSVTFADNSAVRNTSTANTSSGNNPFTNLTYGGAIYAGSASSSVQVESNTGLVSFSGNKAKSLNSYSSSSTSSSSIYSYHDSYSYGGAIYAGSDSLVSLRQNTRGLDISGNQALSSESLSASLTRSTYSADLAVYVESLTLSSGGAIYSGAGSEMRLDGNGGVVSICENAAVSETSAYSKCTNNHSASGYDVESRVTSEAYSYGGALYGGANSGISVSANADGVSLSGNYATAVSSAEAYAYSASGLYYTSAYITSKAKAYGGAVYGDSGTSIELDGNAGGLTISGNYAQATASSKVTRTSSSGGNGTANSDALEVIALGGAIYAGSNSQLSISGNTGGVTISGNYVVSAFSSTTSGDLSLAGGAIYSQGSIAIQNNDSVLFTGNYEKYAYGTSSGTYRLRSIYMNSGAADGGSFALSAAAGNSITFEDCIYVATGTSGQTVGVTFNADYIVGDATLAQAGDIIFDGSKAAAALESIKGSAATASELLNSQKSYIGGQIKLQGGRLVVRDGAQLNGLGLISARNSGAALVLQNAGMNHSGSFNIQRGTSLELSGVNTMTTSTLSLASRSTLKFELSGENRDAAVLSLDANLEHFSITLALNGADMLASGRYKLVDLEDANRYSSVDYWTSNDITVTATGDAAGLGFDDLVWEDGVLYVEQGKTIWNNGSGDGVWNASSANWQRNGLAVNYRDGMDVKFDDSAAGMVQLEGAVSPLSVEVDNSIGNDYTFTGSGSLSGSSSLVKNGSGALSLATANEYTGGTRLNGGTLNVQHSQALGAAESTVVTAAGTQLNVMNNAAVVLAATEGNDLAGQVSVAAGASLEVKGTGYHAEATQLAGELIFSGAGVNHTGEGAGSLSGNGHLKVQGAGSAVSFSSAADYVGSVSLGGGAEFSADVLEMKEGAMLSALSAGSSLGLSDVMLPGAAQVEMHTTRFESYSGTLNVDMAANAYTAGSIDTASGLVLQGGATYQATGSSLDLGGSTLTLSAGEGNPFVSLMLELDGLYTPVDTQIVLFTGVSSLVINAVEFSGADTAHVFAAADYLKGDYVFETTALVYDGNVGCVYLVEAMPEPTTTTLSLLALAGLAARRRRR